MDEICITLMPEEDDPAETEKFIRESILSKSVLEFQNELDGTYVETSYKGSFENVLKPGGEEARMTYDPLETAEVTRERGNVYLYGAWVSYWIVESLAEIVLNLEPCDGMILIAHTNDDEFIGFGRLYQWTGDGYEQIDSGGDLTGGGYDEAVREYFGEHHDMFARTYTYDELEPLPEESE